MSFSNNATPTLPSISEALKSPHAVASSSVLGADGTTIVRLVLRDSGIDLAFDIAACFAPDGSTYDLDPYLTDASRRKLMDLGLLPSDPMDARVEGSGLALDIAVAHRALIAQTLQEALSS